jgi:hypothetical protein
MATSGSPGTADNIWDMLSAVGTVAAALVALAIAVFQIHETRRQMADARKTAARTAAVAAYDAYLQLAILHPDLANGDLEKIKSHGKFEKYEWFFSFMASACEQILLHTHEGERAIWASTVRSQVGYHAAYVTEYRDQIASHYSSALNEILIAVSRKSS